jgi:hypothetical protein
MLDLSAADKSSPASDILACQSAAGAETNCETTSCTAERRISKGTAAYIAAPEPTGLGPGEALGWGG